VYFVTRESCPWCLCAFFRAPLQRLFTEEFLSEIYNIPSTVHACASHISAWINILSKKPILIGPDSESEQWVAGGKKNANTPL
jgi:hypothetical protein